jgi:hypothetical protein
MAIGVQHQHPGTVGERHAIDAVLPVQLHQLPLHQGRRLGIVDEGLVFQLQMTPSLSHACSAMRVKWAGVK